MFLPHIHAVLPDIIIKSTSDFFSFCLIHSLVFTTGQACGGASVPGEGLPPLHRWRPQQAGAGAEPGDGRSHQHPAAQPAEGRDRHHRGEGGGRSGGQPHPSHLR